MSDDETLFDLERLLQKRITLVSLEQLAEQRCIRALRHDALLVERMQNAARSPADKLDDSRVVHILEVSLGQLDALGRVLLLDGVEDCLVERRLQPLVAKVDTQLLERVDFERLKAKDIQDPDELPSAAVVFGEVNVYCPVEAQRSVDLGDEPVKDGGVDGARKAMAQLRSFRGRVGRADPL